jgi:Membrane protease subunits, stomatin/prohibitin homologs
VGGGGSVKKNFFFPQKKEYENFFFSLKKWQGKRGPTVAKNLFKLKRERGRSKKIWLPAGREFATIIAEAYNQAQGIKGEGDAISTETYAEAYSLSPEFYSFYRSLTAYRESFNAKQDVLVIKPDSDFFKYFTDPQGTK